MDKIAMLPKIENMLSPRTGKPVANQYIIVQEGGILGNFIKREVFQSYKSIIASVTYWGDNNDNKIEVVLDEYYWNYSVTTSKYRNEFLKETTQETKKKIASGLYKLANLN